MKRVAADAIALKLELEGIAKTKLISSIDAVATSIEAKGIDIERATAPNGTVTLLFSEMERFAELAEELGDAEAHRLMQTQRAILTRELSRHGGIAVEEQRDGILLAFPKASESLRYATSVQRALAAHRAEHPEEPIHVRMGIHTGEPVREGDRFFGKTVILAACIASRAEADEIFVSTVAHDLAEPTGEFHFDDGELTELEGLSGVHRIYALAWSEDRPPRAAPKAIPNIFRREGDYWAVSYEGRWVRMKDAKGMQYIAALLRRQGEEVHVSDLVNGGPIARNLDDDGEVLDARARDDYRERLETLRFELEEARGINDPRRSTRLQQEIELITQELAAAYGLGGRSRWNPATADRKRKAVSSRVLESISRLRKESPDLSAHLTNSIHLGLFCRYAPEKPIAWSL